MKIKKIVMATLAAALLVSLGNTVTVYAGAGDSDSGGNVDIGGNQDADYDTSFAEITYASYLTDLSIVNRNGNNIAVDIRGSEKHNREVAQLVSAGAAKSNIGTMTDPDTGSTVSVGVSITQSSGHYTVKFNNVPVLEYDNSGVNSRMILAPSDAARAYNMLCNYIASQPWRSANLELEWYTGKIVIFTSRSSTSSANIAQSCDNITSVSQLVSTVYHEEGHGTPLDSCDIYVYSKSGTKYTILPNQFITMWSILEPYAEMPEEMYERLQVFHWRLSNSALAANKSIGDLLPRPGEREGLYISLNNIGPAPIPIPDVYVNVAFNYNGGRDRENRTSYTLSQVLVGSYIDFPEGMNRSSYEFAGWTTDAG